MRVIELMDFEAGIERRRETHCVDGLVHRFLDQEGREGRQLGDAAGEFDGAIRQLVVGEHLAHHADGVGFVGVQQLSLPCGPELPRVAEVLDPAHAEPGADDVGENGVLTGDDEVTAPRQHESGRQDHTVDLGDSDLAQIAPALGVLEEVVPLLAVA
ncbi:hypothetical protein MGAD_00070 [Mycolicibacterium gadium]|uniref:Uncharacterized protein n=1 Tax=Mycolicibacterium gadium TaxID=1794 RepID=A0A7I7WFR2_MYCGU|nr:hypothetical protein MGAD_00070 [Mycolicibacterium gadium]